MPKRLSAVCRAMPSASYLWMAASRSSPTPTRSTNIIETPVRLPASGHPRLKSYARCSNATVSRPLDVELVYPTHPCPAYGGRRTHNLWLRRPTSYRVNRFWSLFCSYFLRFKGNLQALHNRSFRKFAQSPSTSSGAALRERCLILDRASTEITIQLLPAVSAHLGMFHGLSGDLSDINSLSFRCQSLGSLVDYFIPPCLRLKAL